MSMVGLRRMCCVGAMALLVAGCGTIPTKKYYLLNYVPTAQPGRLHTGPYPCTVRLKEFDIEEAYNRPQIVYRRNPFELQYYYYRVWAVKPTRMITDLVNKHLAEANLVSTIARRFDEGTPEYELSGAIEGIEEYDNETVWFAHIAVRFKLTRIKDGVVLYNRRFDNRKQVFENQPEFVIKEMSKIMEYIMNQVVHDLDVTLAREFGTAEPVDEPVPADPDSSADTPDPWTKQGTAQ